LYPVEYRWFKRGAVWPDTYRWRILFVSGGIYSRRYPFCSVRLQSFSPGDLRYLSYRGVCLADLLDYYRSSASRVLCRPRGADPNLGTGATYRVGIAGGFFRRATVLCLDDGGHETAQRRTLPVRAYCCFHACG